MRRRYKDTVYVELVDEMETRNKFGKEVNEP